MTVQSSECHVSHTERTKLHLLCGLYPVCHVVRNLMRATLMSEGPAASPDGSGETHSGLTDWVSTCVLSHFAMAVSWVGMWHACC